MDRYSPGSVTVSNYQYSAAISRLPDNGTSIVANREYTITVSAISDQGFQKSYPSDSFIVSEYS